MRTALDKKIVSRVCDSCDGTGQDWTWNEWSQEKEKIYLTGTSCTACGGSGTVPEHKTLAKQGFSIERRVAPMWTITHDHLDNKPMDKKSYDFVQEEWDAIPEEEKVEIQIFDDDGELYYSGLHAGINEDEEIAFAPLDWAMIQAGCTTLKYKDKTTGGWEVL